MKSRALLFALIFSLMTIAEAPAEEMKISGEATVTAQHLNINGEKAKFNEYRDYRDGFTGDAEFQYERGNYYMDFTATNIGRKDQSYDFSGGKWGSFKYDFKYDQIPHNFTYDAKSFYNGIGGANLTYGTHPPTTNFGTWNTFDYSLERSNFSGGIKFDLLKPFFFDVSVSQMTNKGVYPLGVAGTTPGGIAIELPSPIEYTTNNMKLAAGYIKNPLSLSVSYLYSQFIDQKSNLNFRNPATANTAATTDTYTLPPNNDSYKLDFQGTLKLPLNSKFSADLAIGQTTSSFNLANSYVSNVTAAASNIGQQGRSGVLLSDYVFNGKFETQNYNFVLTSNPLHYLDGKLFYKYNQRKNKSDEITTVDGANTFINAPFGYKTSKGGGQIGFKLPASFYLSGAYSYAEIEREGREDIPKDKDNLYDIELRWSGVDFMVAKAAYQRLHRVAEFESPAVTGRTDVKNIETYIRRYDAASKDQDTYKVSFDFFPIEDLNFSLGYKYVYANYPDTILGLNEATRNGVSVDGDYFFLKQARLFGYFDYEYVKYKQLQRQLPSGTTAFNPDLPPTSTAFNWTVCQTEKNYSYGVGADLFILPKKWTLRLQTNYYQSDGFADLSYLLGTNPLPAGRTNSNIDISNWDDYRITNYVIKAIYTMDKNLSFVAGWAYEKYVYNDAQLNGYLYVPGTTGTGGAYLTGAYADPNYRANVYFLNATMRF